MKENVHNEFIDEIIKYASARQVDEMSSLYSDEVIEAWRFSEGFSQGIHSIMLKHQKKIHARKFRKNLLKVCAGIVIFLFIGCITIYSVDAFRVPVLNFISGFNGDSTTIHTYTRDADYSKFKDEIQGLYLPQYLPSGYQLDTIGKAGEMYHLEFKNKENDVILLQPLLDNTTLGIDNELKQETIEVNGSEARIFTGKDTVILLFSYQKHSFQLIAHTDRIECLKIAESMAYNK